MRRWPPAPHRPVLAKATCPLCGDIEMPITGITLHLQAPSYSFVCPLCEETVEKPASTEVERLLFVYGAVVSV